MQAQMNPDLAQALQSVVTRLAGRYRGMFSEETVANTVRNAYLQLNRGATVRSMFMPALAERFARDQLRAAAQAEGLIPKDVPEVLFVCVRNAGRSQMAAAIAHHLSKGRVGVRSAGSEPGGAIHPTIIEAMSEIGLDVTEEFPKPLTDVVVRAADVVVTMGCGDACPVYPGKHYEDWPVADPWRQPLEAVRLIRLDIYHHVRDLLDGLLSDGTLAKLHAPRETGP